jgi:hypothetical protein
MTWLFGLVPLLSNAIFSSSSDRLLTAEHRDASSLVLAGTYASQTTNTIYTYNTTHALRPK